MGPRKGCVIAAEEILIFANPIAGRGQGLQIARRLEKRFGADGYDVRVLLDRPDALRRDDLPAGACAAVVIGGDGTLRAVADRLCSARHGAPLLVVPLGTANLMGRHLGIRWADDTLEDQVSAAMVRRRVVQLDAGRAGGRLFLLMVGVGFDAAVVHELDRVRRGPIGYLNYVLPAAMALTAYQYPALRVTVDGREVWRAGPAVVFVGNVPEYGTGFPILSRARPDDGLLDVCVMPCRTPVDLARFLLLSTTGDHLLADGVLYATGRHVTVESPGAESPVPVQIDGDSAGHTPVSIDLLPVRLAFIVP